MWRTLIAGMGMAAIVAACATPPRPRQGEPGRGAFAREFAAPGGFSYEEAAAFVEFCIELDNQDTRARGGGTPQDAAVVDPGKWKLIYDSRQALAEDYFTYKREARLPPVAADGRLPDDDVRHWGRVFANIDKLASGQKLSLNAPGDIQGNPILNGFGPWSNAWLLYEGMGPNQGRYAVAIRGTVFEAAPSAIEDGIFQPVEGHDFLTHAVSFSQDPNAIVHSGFAHATFTLMLDGRYGVLPVLKKMEIPAGSTLYIVGHSQGAAMATLVHAFLFNAMVGAETSGNDPFQLKGLRYKLKSYVFAQPKPGNYAFCAEFASYTQGPDTALVINNDIDPVPKVPLTIGSTVDLETDFHGQFLLARAVYALGATGKWFRRGLSEVLEWWTIRSARGFSYFYQWQALQPLLRLRSGSSWGFVPAGRVIFVYGTPQQNQGQDVFFQHHATTYRALLEGQLK